MNCAYGWMALRQLQFYSLQSTPLRRTTRHSVNLDIEDVHCVVIILRWFTIYNVLQVPEFKFISVWEEAEMVHYVSCACCPGNPGSPDLNLDIQYAAGCTVYMSFKFSTLRAEGQVWITPSHQEQEEKLRRSILTPSEQNLNKLKLSVIMGLFLFDSNDAWKHVEVIFAHLKKHFSTLGLFLRGILIQSTRSNILLISYHITYQKI